MITIIFFLLLSSTLFGYDLNSSDIEKDSGYSIQKRYLTNTKDGSYQKMILSADNSIDETTYYIGSGDAFFVSIKGGMVYQGLINQNKDLFIPEIGIIKIGKKTLLDAKKEIEYYFEKKFKKEVYISLNKIKNSTIYLRGQLRNPGTVNLPGNYRLLDAIIYANEGTLPSFFELNLRNIKCLQSDSVKQFDLFKYLFKGDEKENPYIYSGDVISVSYPHQKVFISGEVDSITGFIPVTPDEDISELLDLLPLRPSSDSTNIIVQRINPENGNRSITKINYKIRESFILQDQDMITITKKENYPEVVTASVTGGVVRPGTYPICKNTVTAREMISQAGGVSQQGDMNRAVILRNNKKISGNVSVQEVRPELNSAMASIVNKSDHTVIYLRDNKEIYLQPNDQIFIPPVEHFVYVSGSVKNPGGIPYEPGKNKSYYIDKAGGLQKSADKKNTFVMVTYNNNTVVSKGTDNVEAGDIIVVPISRENKTLSNVIIPLVSVISTTLVVLLSAYNTINN